MSQFAYDGKMRRRVRKEFTWTNSAWAQTNLVYYVYDGNVVIQERDLNNLPTTTYTRGKDVSGSMQRAGGIGGLLARADNTLNQTACYHSDANGNVTMLLNSSNAIVAKYLYDSFGNVLSAFGSLAAANLYRFSSKEAHINSGLNYYLYRYYDPNLQRWQNKDPLCEIGFKTMVATKGSRHFGVFRKFAEQLKVPNLYFFVANNPISDLDLLGLTDYNCSQTYQQLAQAHAQATAGPIQGLQNIYNNSSGGGDDDYAYNGHGKDTWCVNGHKMNADQMANFMLGFQAQSYDNAFPLMENVAMEVGYAAGVWYHSTGQSKAANDPLDLTGLPDIAAGAEAADRWPFGSGSQCCKQCN